MATRGSIPTIMKQAGIDMLPPEAGIPVVRRELTQGQMHEEIVVAGSLGIMQQEFDATGGLDLSEASPLHKQMKSRPVLAQKIRGMDLYSGLIVEAELDPKAQPFLYDHQINGTAVLPGVMGLEALAEAAKVLFPDRHAVTIENVDFHAPFKFYRDQPRTVQVQANFRADGNEIIAECRLIGSRKLHGRDEPEVTTHFTGTVRLSREMPETRTAKVPGRGKAKAVAAEAIYKLYFHGPAYQVLETAWRTGKKVIGRFAKKLPANHEPQDLSTVLAPRFIELCFQTAGLWEMGEQGRMGLPSHIDRLVLHTGSGKERAAHAIVTPGTNGSFDAIVVDGKGRVLLELTGYRTMEIPENIDAGLLAPLQEMIQPTAKKANRSA